jgi:hypothetical protein
MKTKVSLKRAVERMNAVKEAMRKEIEEQKKVKEKPKP